MLTIAVVDDDPYFLAELSEALAKWTENYGAAQITPFSDSAAFLQSSEIFDMVFMDIDMPGLSGMETAALLRERNCNTTLIFVSSYEHFVFESIRYMPFRFIRKSLYQEEVPEALQSWFAIQSNQKQSITLRTGTGNANTFLLSEVIDFYAVRHDIYVLKQTHDSIQLYGRDMTMEKLEELTADTGFLRPHKSWLVNFRYIHQIFREEIILKSGDHIPLSRRRTNEIRLQYSKLLRERDRI